MNREHRVVIRVVALLGILGTIGLGVGGYLYYRHWSQQRSREESIARFSDAERTAASGVIIYRSKEYPVARGSALWRELVAAIHQALKTGPGPVSYYHPTDQAIVFALVSAEGVRLCEVRIEDEFVRVDERDAIVNDVDLHDIIASHLFARNGLQD